jgi:hypothetical protein
MLKKEIGLVLFGIMSFVMLAGCDLFETNYDDDNNSNSNSISVSVSPGSVTLAKGTTQQFSATVSGSNYGYNGVSWSLEGTHDAGTTVDRDGLLTVAANETSRNFNVKATSTYDDKSSGIATVTVATDGEIPSGLYITKPEAAALSLSWSAVSNASAYKVYRSNDGKTYSQLASVAATTYKDVAVGAGASYYYAVSATVSGLETGKSSPAFSFANDYFAFPVFAGRRLVPLAAGKKHYYRFPVTSGESYTIVWENGNGGDSDYYYTRAAAWQNNGTSIFSNAANGYTSQKVFTASSGGYITVEISNTHSSNNYDYMAYCYGTNGNIDTGVVPLPPVSVTGFKVYSATSSALHLSWNSVSEAVRYNIYRANTQTSSYGKIGESTSTSYTDEQVGSGAAYFYTIAAVNAGGLEGVKRQDAFAITRSHYNLSNYSSSQLMTIEAGAYHYYRLAVTSGEQYTVTWENGSAGDSDYYYTRAAAWQNNGTSIFINAANGYTSPKVITASSDGYITVEIKNTHSSNSYNYKVYCY